MVLRSAAGDAVCSVIVAAKRCARQSWAALPTTAHRPVPRGTAGRPYVCRHDSGWVPAGGQHRQHNLRVRGGGTDRGAATDVSPRTVARARTPPCAGVRADRVTRTALPHTTNTGLQRAVCDFNCAHETQLNTRIVHTNLHGAIRRDIAATTHSNATCIAHDGSATITRSTRSSAQTT